MHSDFFYVYEACMGVYSLQRYSLLLSSFQIIICTFAVKNITNVSIYGTYYTYNQREESLSYGN